MQREEGFYRTYEWQVLLIGLVISIGFSCYGIYYHYEIYQQIMQKSPSIDVRSHDLALPIVLLALPFTIYVYRHMKNHDAMPRKRNMIIFGSLIGISIVLFHELGGLIYGEQVLQKNGYEECKSLERCTRHANSSTRCTDVWQIAGTCPETKKN